MSYEPTNWKTGDIITAEKLNKIETELASKFLIVIEEDGHLSRTWQEIYDALYSYRIPIIFYNELDFPFCHFEVITGAAVDATDNTCLIFIDHDEKKPAWAATAPGEYPVLYSK